MFKNHMYSSNNKSLEGRKEPMKGTPYVWVVTYRRHSYRFPTQPTWNPAPFTPSLRKNSVHLSTPLLNRTYFPNCTY